MVYQKPMFHVKSEANETCFWQNLWKFIATHL